MAEEAGIHQDTNHPRGGAVELNELRRQAILCDVVLKVGGESFPVHRIVLATTSPYFRRMFITKPNVGKMHDIPISGIESGVFENILTYVYTGKIVINGENVLKLWISSHQLQLIFLRDECASFLIAKLQSLLCEDHPSGNNVLSIRFLANGMDYTRLVAAADKFIGDNLEQLMSSAEFLALSSTKLCDLIGSDFLYADSEEIIFEACIKWIKFDEEKRRPHSPQVLEKIRWQLLSSRFLEEQVRNEEIIISSEPCRRSVEEARRSQEVPLETSRSRDNDPFGIILIFGGEYHEGNVEIHDIFNLYVSKDEESIPCKRTNMGGSVLKDKVYILGGQNDRCSLATVEVFDGKTEQWSQGREMTTARKYPAVAVFDKFIYVCGGSNEIGTLRSVECYDPDHNTWTQLNDMRERRSDACAVALNGHIYVIGGMNENDEALDTVERFNPMNNTWEKVEPLTENRGSFGAAVLEGKIYVCGGQCEDDVLKSVEVYDPIRGTWSPVAEMISKRTNFALVSNIGQLWAIGGVFDKGHDESNTLHSIEAYNPDTEKWTITCPLNYKRGSLLAAVIPFS